MVQSKIRPKRNLIGMVVGVIACGLFGLVGLGAFLTVVVLPFLEWWDAGSWIEATCVVESSEVVTGTDSEGDTTYKPVIRYSYLAGGTRYVQTRYDLSPFSNKGSSESADIVASYPEGAEVPCFIDPDEPGSAVLVRSFVDGGVWIAGPLTLAFGIGPVLMIAYSARRKRRKQDRAPSTAAAGSIGSSPAEPVGAWRALEPEQTVTTRFFLFSAIAVVTNGLLIPITGSMLAEGEWCTLVIVLPFALVGVGFGFAAVWKFLALFNPRLQLEVSPSRPRLGDEVEVRWRFAGRTGRIQQFELRLKAQEWVRYRRGTKTVTVAEPFHDERIHEEVGLPRPSGSKTMTIPADLLPSFDATDNKITWRITLAADIPWWPDIGQKYILEVLPSLPGEDA